MRAPSLLALLTDTQRNLWWGAVIGGFVVVLAVAALLTILVLLVRTIDRRVRHGPGHPASAAETNTADTALIGETAERRRGGAGRGPRAPPVPRPGAREGAVVTTLVVLSVVDIVLLIAGLAFYLFVVGGQLTRVATNLEECAEIVRDDRAATPSRSCRASSTSTAPAASSPARCRCSTAWPRASWSASTPQPEPAGRAAAGRAGVGHPPVAAARRRSATRPRVDGLRADRDGRVAAPGRRRGRSLGSRPVVSGPVVGASYSPIHSSFQAWSYCCSLQPGW